MNEPIISPWLIYWAGRIEFIQIICCVVGLVVTAFAVTATMAVLTDDYEHDESVVILSVKLLKLIMRNMQRLRLLYADGAGGYFSYWQVVEILRGIY